PTGVAPYLDAGHFASTGAQMVTRQYLGVHGRTEGSVKPTQGMCSPVAAQMSSAPSCNEPYCGNEAYKGKLPRKKMAADEVEICDHQDGNRYYPQRDSHTYSEPKSVANQTQE
ncbi:MAG: hypothetical protein M0Z42_22375, partial [Actinomycetota bacterium]|nr:hypothetical protein [Actinomycetota bacterium]